MKKFLSGILTLVLILTLHLTTGATPRFYIVLGGGYSGVLSPQEIPAELLSGGFSFQNYDADQNSITIHSNMNSLGSGTNASLMAGFAITQGFSVEMGFQHLWSNTITANQTNYLKTTSNNFERHYTLPKEISLSASMYRLNPAISISTNLFGMKPFARLGLLVGWGSLDFHEDLEQIDIETKQSVRNSELRLEMSGDYALGLSADLGLEFALTERLSFIAEVKTISMDYSPLKGKVNFAEIDNKDVLSLLNTSQKEFDFVNSVTVYVSDTPNPDKPTQVLKNSFPFNSIGFNIGLKFGF